MSEAKTAKIRAALAQLDPQSDGHWTDDGLPREGVVRKIANDQTITRKEIQAAYPGFQRTDLKPQPPAATVADHDPLTGEPTGAGLGADPAKNTGELMTEAEVKAELEARCVAAERELVDAQQAVRDANTRVADAQKALSAAKLDYNRSYPPLTQAQNVKEYIASEMAQRAAAMQGRSYPGATAPGSQIDAAMQRGNSRGWRRPSRVGPTQTGAARPAA